MSSETEKTTKVDMGDGTDQTRAIRIDTHRAEQALAAVETARKKATQTMNDVLIQLDELPKHERERVARAVAIYYEVYR